MPKIRNENISSLPVIDLAYAVSRLVAMGKATQAEILQLAAERGRRISVLQAELSALRHGVAVATVAARLPARPAAKPATAKKPAAAKKHAAAKRPVASKAPAPKKLTITPARAAQLKVQGMYIGMMRSLAVPVKTKIKAIAKDKGMPAAIEAMKKLPRK